MENLTFNVQGDIDGGYNARAITESIFTQADTLEQLNLNIAEAIECHFDDDILPGLI
ncbi:MAG: 2-oxoisovalerate dehydrogenase E1 subunit beta [Bacteroidetes bacterium]|nr:2-oxoisovalerate dehydrogenase E1 subunit beta [Bacteroidota bacterium]